MPRQITEGKHHVYVQNVNNDGIFHFLKLFFKQNNSNTLFLTTIYFLKEAI